MDTIQTLTEKIVQKCNGAQIFYVTPDVERAIGLENLFPNFHIICLYKNEIIDYMRRSKVKVFCLEERRDKSEKNRYRYSNYILTHPLVQQYIQEQNGQRNGYLMFFKIAPNIERSAKEMGFSILNTSAKLNAQFELKLSQYFELSKLPIDIPKMIISTFKEAEYTLLQQKLGHQFIVQYDRGHTGGGTRLVSSPEVFSALQRKFPDRKVRFAEIINGDPYTLNACITRHGICWGALSRQLTGISESTAERFATVGNDFYFPKYLSDQARNNINICTTIVGEHMQKAGFKGLFGIDVIIEKKTNKTYVIEINARQPASISFFTKLQLLKNQIPLNLLSLAEFLDIEYKIDIPSYNLAIQQPYEAAQLFMRNKYSTHAKVIGSIKPGLYRLQGVNSAFIWSKGKPKIKRNVISIDEDRDKQLIFTNESYAFNSPSDIGIILLSAPEDTIVHSNGETARLQAQDTFLDKTGKLTYLTTQIISGLENYVILRKLNHERNTT
jgi:hypothetical protein